MEMRWLLRTAGYVSVITGGQLGDQVVMGRQGPVSVFPMYRERPVTNVRKDIGNRGQVNSKCL